MRLEQLEKLQTMRVSQKASDLKFKLIGKRTVSKQARSISVAEMQNVGPTPYTKSSYYANGQNDEGTNQYSKSKQKYSAIEDTRVSRFTHHKILIVEKNVLLLSLLVIFFGMMKLEADGIYPSGVMSQKIMMIMSCVTIILILLVVVRRVLKLQLEMDQKQIYIRKNNRTQCKSTLLLLLCYKKQVLALLVEVVAIIPHPIGYLQGATYSYYSENHQADLNYSVNDLLSVLMLFKIYLVFRSLISLSIYSSPRMVRLCRNNNFEYNFFYSIKCIQHQHPIFFIAFVFALTLFIFAFGFRVTEGNLYSLNQSSISPNGYESYFNCIWFTFISMTSLGYGDLTPNTIMARILASILTVFGLTLNSFLVVAFSEYLKMKAGQIRSHTTLSRLQEYNILKSQSAETLAEIIKVSHYMSRKNLDPMMMRKLKPMFNELKRKIDSTKAETHRIRAILPQENKTELMIHEFEVLKDNFKEVHLKQRKIRDKIVKIEQKKDSRSHARESFLNEVNSLLNRFK